MAYKTIYGTCDTAANKTAFDTAVANANGTPIGGISVSGTLVAQAVMVMTPMMKPMMKPKKAKPKKRK